MENRKKFIFIFSLFWVVGLLGGYFFAVDSAILPNQNSAYQYYSQQHPQTIEHQNTEIEHTVFKTEVKQVEKQDCDAPAKDRNTSFFKIQNFKVLNKTKRILRQLILPTAAAQPNTKQGLKQTTCA